MLVNIPNIRLSYNRCSISTVANFELSQSWCWRLYLSR